MDRIEKKLSKIDNVTDIGRVIKHSDNKEEVGEYYASSFLAYLLFHSSEGHMHMGVSENGQYSNEDLWEIPRKISEYVDDSKTTSVLELGCGAGVNIEYLADRNNESYFFGVDLSQDNVERARQRLEDFKNCEIDYGDYHDLSRYEEDSMDVVFGVESLCYSNRIEKVFSEVKRVLDPEGGVFISSDGYLAAPKEDLSNTEKLAQKLLVRGMAVDEFTVYDEFKEKAREEGFKLEKEEDLSEAILPTAKQFESMNRIVYNLPFLTNTIRPILRLFSSEKFRYNSISGYLMSDLVERGIDTYYFSVAQLEEG